MTVVPIAAVSNTNPEVVPLSPDVNTDNADLLTAESSSERGGMISPSIDSINDQNHGSDDGHSDAPGDDDDGHFAY